MKKLISVTAVFIAVILLTGAVLMHDTHSNDNRGKYVVALNEISHLAEKGNSEDARIKADELRKQIAEDQENGRNSRNIAVLCGIDVAVLIAMAAYCGMTIIRPFSKLTDFAERMGNGDFDESLEYPRTNYFGKFIWALDNMRREITKARACEKEAIENNKTVIASLSHDIKTPAASIRAYAEALEMGMDGSPEKRSKYLEVIMRKCDEVAKLTNDIFLHSIADLDKLKINAEKFEICSFVSDTLSELYADQKDIIFEKPCFTADVSADKGRTAQMIENLINNARKYARTDVTITIDKDTDFVNIRFRDRGKGIPDEDMPFIFNKFYRGKNCGEESGSGLGLFIVRYIAQQSGGDVKLRNFPDGLEAVISLPLYKEGKS